MLSDLAIGVCTSLGTLGVAAGGCAYAAMWPTSQLFGPTLIAPRRAGQIALTFDDGPNPSWTPQLIDILDRHNVKATFFFIGRYAKAEPLLARYVAEAGHAIGNHTWTHPNLALTAPSRVREELRTTKDTLEQILGRPVRLFRPPFGARRPDVLHAARNLGMTPVLWNAMTHDWSELSAGTIAAQLTTKVEAAFANGHAANIVLHDGGHLDPQANRGPSVQAARMLLERYAKPRKFVSIEDWTSS